MPFSKNDPDSARNAGRKGGLKTKARMLAKDPHYYEKIGTLGGQAMKSRDPEHYRTIGRMGRKEAQA